MVHCCFRYCGWILMLFHCLEDRSLKVRPSTNRKGQAVCCPIPDAQTRRPQATLHDSTLSSTLFYIKWSVVNVPDCAPSRIRVGNSPCVTETIDTCLHWKQTCGHCEKWREDGCGDESHQLRQYRNRRSTRTGYRLVHLSEVEY